MDELLVSLWLALVFFSPLAGTVYWFSNARRAPNRDLELIGLIALYVFVADLLIVWYAFRVACDGIVENWSSH